MSARRHIRRPLLAALFAGLIGGVGALPAQAQTTRLLFDAQGGVGYATNPFLISGDDKSSAYAELTLQPELLHHDDLGDASLIAHYRRTEYFTRFDGVDSYGAEARARRRLSQLVSIRAGLVYDSSILGQSSFGGATVVDSTTPPPIGTPDITLLGLRERQKSLTASLGADWRLTERDTVTTDARVGDVDYGADSLTSSRSVSGTVSYSRSLSSRTSVGVQGSGSWIDFRRPGFSGSFYQPQLTVNHQLSETVHFSLAGGLLFVTSKTDRGTQRTTGFSGSFYGCKDGSRSTICLRAYSDAQATGIGDVSRRYGAGAEYSYLVAENDVLRLSADYSRVRETSDLLQPSSVSYFNAGGSFEHSFSRRLFAGLTAGYRNAAGGGGSRPSDVNVKAFVRTRLGDPQ